MRARSQKLSEVHGRWSYHCSLFEVGAPTSWSKSVFLNCEVVGYVDSEARSAGWCRGIRRGGVTSRTAGIGRCVRYSRGQRNVVGVSEFGDSGLSSGTAEGRRGGWPWGNPITDEGAGRASAAGVRGYRERACGAAGSRRRIRAYVRRRSVTARIGDGERGQSRRSRRPALVLVARCRYCRHCGSIYVARCHDSIGNRGTTDSGCRRYGCATGRSGRFPHPRHVIGAEPRGGRCPTCG